MNRELARDVAAVRSFNRFYTKQIGVLKGGLYNTGLPLPEVRVLYEIAHGDEQMTATRLQQELGLDPGYLSRILTSLKRRGLVDRKASIKDMRQNLLWLTDKGREAFAAMNARSIHEIAMLLESVPAKERPKLIAAMRTIQSTFSAQPQTRPPYLLRTHQPGDMGWIVHRHGVLYTQEQGWDEGFEALVAGIVSKFIVEFDPKRERCWIAEVDGEFAGCVVLVNHSERVGQLRLLLVEPKARGMGIGTRLVAELIRFAKQVGYEKITLWTQSQLKPAIRLYQEAGFKLVSEEPHLEWGYEMTGQQWELDMNKREPARAQFW